MRVSLKRGDTDVDALDEYGFAPIHYAAKFNSVEDLKLLVKNGAGRYTCMRVFYGISS